MSAFAAPTHALISARGLSKSFHGMCALEDVQFDLRPGEVHVLMGENGARKSTRMKVLTGNLPPRCRGDRAQRHAGRLHQPPPGPGRRHRHRASGAEHAITQNPVCTGYKTVKALKGEKLPKIIDTGFYGYDKNNIAEPKVAALLYG